MNWYIIQAYSGFEKKVVESIKDTLAKNKLKLTSSEVTELINKVRAQAGKEPVKPKKGHSGYSSLTEIERIKLDVKLAELKS